MPPEIIDLTGSPPPPSRSSEGPRIINFAAANSAEQVHFGNLAMCLWPNPNPDLPYTNQQQASVWPASMHIYDPSQAAISFQSNMHGDQVASVLAPVPEASAFLFPHGTRIRDPWTPRDHELFLMGLIKYGRGRWTKIARHFLSNKTPQQVQSYANSFFRHLPSTHLYSFRRRNSAYSTASFMTAENRMNLMGASASYNKPLITANDNEPIKKTLMLFPEKEPTNFFQVQPFGEACSTTTNYAYYGFQMQTIGASTSMSARGNYGEVDLELRLGRS